MANFKPVKNLHFSIENYPKVIKKANAAAKALNLPVHAVISEYIEEIQKDSIKKAAVLEAARR